MSSRILLALLLLPIACDRAPTARGGGPSPNDHAVSRIVAARCARHERCATIGRGGRYSDRVSCLHNETVITRTELAVCKRVIADETIDACTRAIRFNDCEEPTAPVAPLPECASAALCSK